MAARHRFLDSDSLSFRRIEVAIAALTLLAIAGFLALALGTDASGVTNDVAMGFLWVAVGTTIVLPVIIVTHLVIDALSWIRGEHDIQNQNGAVALLDAILRSGELLLSLVVITILALAVYLFTTVSPGRGAGAIVTWIVFASGTAVTLLSTTVLIRQATSRI